MKYILTIFTFFILYFSHAQSFTKADSLRGSITAERAWWDVTYYDIQIEPNINKHSIIGRNIIHFKTKKPGQKMQIDLQEPMKIDSVLLEEAQVPFKRDGNIFYLMFENELLLDKDYQIQIYFSGKPRKAINAPWDGGWIWKKDQNGNPWVSVACQGLGASVWYPCKDHQSDEPDKGAKIEVIVPSDLKAISNGKFIGKNTINKKTIYYWEVKNPINNYDISVYIGKYEHWSENFLGKKGDLSLDFWVLEPNLEKAKKQFKQVKPMLTCFEDWFGPYPFYEDGFKIVEAPFLGMEHQSAIAYGNNYENGYLGKDISNSGSGDKWDFILIHESGHEWFGNSITSKDIADMWIHEGFTSYSEVIFTEYLFDKNTAEKYVQGIRKRILNDKPIIGYYNVNNEGSGDMYYKGSNLIHLIRQLINNDDKFKELIRNINKEFYHKTISTTELENYIQNQTGLSLEKVFNQYLRSKQIPVLEYKKSYNSIEYRWSNCIENFNMKVKTKNGVWLHPTTEWKTFEYDSQEEFETDPNFYIQLRKLN
jgi:aminopeptidase N